MNDGDAGMPNGRGHEKIYALRNAQANFPKRGDTEFHRGNIFMSRSLLRASVYPSSSPSSLFRIGLHPSPPLRIFLP